jgi:hypothetical protein
MTDNEERAYETGSRATWLRLLRLCLKELGHGAEVDAARLALELSETRQALRSVCAKFGDNEWDETEYLPDVVEKHLARHLDEATP